MTATTWAIIVASGKDEMLNEETCTAFLNLNNKPVLSYSLTAMEHCPAIDALVVVAPRDRLEQVVSVIQLFGCHKVRKVVPGAATQFASFMNGMKYVDDDAGIIIAQEASRPGIQAYDLGELVKAAKRHGIAMIGQPIRESTAIADKTGSVEEYPEAGQVWTYGTPMALKTDVLTKILTALSKKKKTVKSMMEGVLFAHQKPRLVPVKHLPAKIDSIEQLRSLEHRGYQ